jgi:hypothetical protein
MKKGNPSSRCYEASPFSNIQKGIAKPNKSDVSGL